MSGRRIGVRLLAVAGAIAFLSVAGCGGEKPLGPTTEQFNQERQALVAKIEKGKKKNRKGKKKGSAVDPAQAGGFGAVGQDFSYVADGKRDPFRSFEWEKLKQDLFDEANRGPLQQFDLSQLSVVGVVWDVNNARALIQDPSGMSYIVGQGARVGKNDGRVIRIDDDLVVVKEKYVDSTGKETIQSVEMRLRLSDGG